jgi:hypothetical protein
MSGGSWVQSLVWLSFLFNIIFIVFKSFVFSVGFIKFSLEHVFSKTNPVDEEELVASLIDKGVICVTALLYIFILRARRW